jgi:RNase P subunit RPR2
MVCKKCGSPHVQVEFEKRKTKPGSGGIHNTYNRKVTCLDCGTVIVDVCDGPHIER